MSVILSDYLKQSITVDSEMFARTSFSLIFVYSLPRKFKVLTNNEFIYI